jgi:hypothetical protein
VSSNAKSAPAADTTLRTFVEPLRPKGRPDQREITVSQSIIGEGTSCSTVIKEGVSS